MGLLLGITGNSGCGQSTAAGFIANRCKGLCSLDRIGHPLLGKNYVLRDLADIFQGIDFLRTSEKELRTELGRIVFDDEKKMTLLNSVLHPRMIRWVAASSAALGSSSGIWILEGALIYELGLHRYMDCIIVVADSAERSAERLSLRDGISSDYALKRWAQQLSIDEKVARSDYVVYNSGDLNYLRQQILTIIEELEDRKLN